MITFRKFKKFRLPNQKEQSICWQSSPDGAVLAIDSSHADGWHERAREETHLDGAYICTFHFPSYSADITTDTNNVIISVYHTTQNYGATVYYEIEMDVTMHQYNTIFNSMSAQQVMGAQQQFNAIFIHTSRLGLILRRIMATRCYVTSIEIPMLIAEVDNGIHLKIIANHIEFIDD